ncbi:MAG: p-hydroxycinnamoyl CoA hydratase/lyase, partial [Chloroflexi bacterium]|nr:p-hydroxycinnamoyl CoA hydratase/lyase [Chloroflexota bacterium]
DQLRDETVKLADKLMTKNMETLKSCKAVFKHVKEMNFNEAEEYMWAKMDSLNLRDPGGRAKGIGQFVDDKAYRPGYTSYTSVDPKP